MQYLNARVTIQYVRCRCNCGVCRIVRPLLRKEGTTGGELRTKDFTNNFTSTLGL